MDSVTYDQFDQKAEAILEQGARHILLDMSKIESISTCGLDVIFGMKKTLEERGGSVAVYDPLDKVKRVFEIVKLLHLVVDRQSVHTSHPFYHYLKNR